MSIQSSDELEIMLWELVEFEWISFQNRLETRFANVLRNKSGLPQAVVINISESVSRQLCDDLTRMSWRTGAVRESLRKILG